MQFLNLFAILFTTCAFFIDPIVASRRFDRRSDVVEIPSVSQYGWTVPLQGSNTCPFSQCKGNGSLSTPLPRQTLQYLALARGFSIWSCEGQSANEPPLFQYQETTLWDAGPLMPKIASEAQFHTLIPQMLEFDYAALKNSSLICIGYYRSIASEEWFELVNATAFPVHIQKLVFAPGDYLHDLQWAQLADQNLDWNIYRVETTGGMPVMKCEGQRNVTRIDYAAEFWFYHR